MPQPFRKTATWCLVPVVGFSLALAGACSDPGASSEPLPGNAASGEALYQKLCASCHGKLGEGTTGPRLVPWTRGAETLVGIIDATMPKHDPARCVETCAKDVAAFILSLESACDAPTFGPRKLRLLNRREYNATVNDLFSLSGPSGASCSSDGDCDVQEASCVGGTCVADPCSVQTFIYPTDKQYGSVHVAGEFNAWAGTVAAGGYAMTYVPAKNLYYAKHTLQNGTYQYKFVIDESNWVFDPANPVKVPDGFGGSNSVLTLGCDAGGSGNAGAYDWAKDFPIESRPKGFGYDDNVDAGLVTSIHVEQYMKAAEALAQKGMENIGGIVPCDFNADPNGCAKTFVTTFGERVFRRPLTPTEVTKYASIVTGQQTFTEGVRVALQVFLSSPYFLYRFEVGVPKGDGTFALTPYEMASALSYSLWGTMPDAALFDAAKSGKLASAAGVAEEARRLLADGRARNVVGTFALQWLGVERVLTADKSTTLFPAYGAAERQGLAEETRQFVTHVMFDGTGKYPELLLGGYTFANDAVGSVYGLPGGLGQTLTKVDQPAERRAGLLGHGSVLASYSHSDQSSPIRRGLFVREMLLCQEFGQPPANAGGVPDIDPNATTRERFAQHTADPACYSCHQYIDDVGFGFERFDAIGKYRDTENGKPIDAAGNMNDVNGMGTNTDALYSTLPELASIIAESRSAKACFATQVHRFATGRSESVADLCALRKIESTFEASGWDMKELVVSVLASDGFRVRK
ncbi:MAG: DUF1592 domain-containing protein [Polyangiaceae bacterium]|nr:DUF1592 domain-containing protein [Polyangiaceae bacterium]